MKTIQATLTLFLGLITGASVFGQADTTRQTYPLYVVIKNDNSEYTGKLLYQDDREVLLETQTVGRVYIPKHEIKEMYEVQPEEFNIRGEYIPEEVYSTRYVITTNGLPIKRGESYVLWNLFGPDIQFAVADNLNVGIITSWLTTPLVGSVKYTFPIGEKRSFGFGSLLGWGSWSASELWGALPYGAFTMGDRRKNLNVAGGYGALFVSGFDGGTGLLSVGGMAKISKNGSFVFDSIIFPEAGFGLIVPTIRIQNTDSKAFQFGFALIYGSGELSTVPWPVLQWFRKM